MLSLLIRHLLRLLLWSRVSLEGRGSIGLVVSRCPDSNVAYTSRRRKQELQESSRSNECGPNRHQPQYQVVKSVMQVCDPSLSVQSNQTAAKLCLW